MYVAPSQIWKFIKLTRAQLDAFFPFSWSIHFWRNQFIWKRRKMYLNALIDVIYLVWIISKSSYCLMSVGRVHGTIISISVTVFFVTIFTIYFQICKYIFWRLVFVRLVLPLVVINNVSWPEQNSLLVGLQNNCYASIIRIFNNWNYSHL